MDIKILEVSFVLSCYIGKRYYFIYYFFVFPICGYVIFFDFMCDWYCFVSLRIMYWPLHSVSLDCPLLIAPSIFSNVVLPNAASFSGLSIVDCPFCIL